MPWKITRISGGTITSGATVYVSYVYAAWVFSEGKDIFSLGYTIDDEDMYRYIAVLGKTAEDTICGASATNGDADTYQILNDKVLIQTDTSLVTDAECLVSAQRLIVTTNASLREVEFEAVGNPYLWVGDCVMVIESSSTISEIYRITELKHSYNPGSRPIFSTSITARHYGYAPA